MIFLDTNIIINLSYKLEDESNWFSQDIPPEKYFELENGEIVEIDCVPAHNHAIDYLDDLIKIKVKATRIILNDMYLKKKRIISESFWNGQKNRVIERIDFEPDEHYNEIIIESQISVKPVITEIMRLVRNEDVLNPIYHGFIQTNPDGTETESKVID